MRRYLKPLRQPPVPLPDTRGQLYQMFMNYFGHRFNIEDLTPKRIWLTKLHMEGDSETLREMAKARYFAAKEANGGTCNKSYSNCELEVLREAFGYTPKAALAWLREETEKLAEEERSIWVDWAERHIKRHDKMQEIGLKTDVTIGSKPPPKRKEKWRRDDMPEEVAWVVAHKALLSERQAHKDEKPLNEDDFAGCPSLAARTLLDYAFNNREKFVESVMKTMMQPFGRREAAVDEATQKIVAVDKQAKAAEALAAEPPPPPPPVVQPVLPPPPVALDDSEAARLIEDQLRRLRETGL